MPGYYLIYLTVLLGLCFLLVRYFVLRRKSQAMLSARLRRCHCLIPATSSTYMTFAMWCLKAIPITSQALPWFGRLRLEKMLKASPAMMQLASG